MNHQHHHQTPHHDPDQERGQHIDEDQHDQHDHPLTDAPTPTRHGRTAGERTTPATPHRLGRGERAMGLMQRLHGHSGGPIRRPRLYEYGAAIGFLGRRRWVYDDLVAYSGAQPGDQILDIGCGTGYFSRRAARAVAPGGHVVGIDPSQPVIEYATRLGVANCTFQLASAQALPYPDVSFDVVMSSLAIHHLPPDDRPIALREAYRVLRPGGRLLIADFRPPRNRIANRLIGALTGHAMQHNPVGRLADLIAQAGFHITGSGDRRPWLHYVQAQRPMTGAGLKSLDRLRRDRSQASTATRLSTTRSHPKRPPKPRSDTSHHRSARRLVDAPQPGRYCAASTRRPRRNRDSRADPRRRGPVHGW